MPTAMKRHFVLVVLLASFGVYANALLNGYVMDDYHLILRNSYIKNFAHLPDVFFSNALSMIDVNTSLYRPFAHLIWMLCYHIIGLAPWGFHLVNVLFHAGASVLVFFVTDRLLHETPDPVASPLVPFAVAMLFAVHPIHTEAVTWVSAGMDVSSAFFYLLAFYLYLSSSEVDSRVPGTRHLSALSFFLATLCKEPAVTLPFVLMAHDFTFRKQGAGLTRYGKKYAPYLVALGAYFALRIAALGGIAPVKYEIGLTAYEFLLNVMVLFTQYLEKLLFPINLNNWHVFHPVHSLFTLRGAISGLTVLGFAVLLLIAQRRNRLAAFGLWVIIIPLLPALYIPGLTQGLENAFTERYLYLPSFGYVLFLGALAEQVWRKRPSWQTMALAAATVILISLFGVGTISRNAVWRDSKSLWSDAARKSPESAQPYNALGDVLRLENRVGEAVEYYKMGLRLNPNSPHIEANIGLSYAELGQVDQAIRHLEQAIKLMPGYGEAYNNLGIAYIQKGQTDAAIRMFQTALRLKPNLADAHHNLGLAMSNIGETDKAIAQYEEALRIDPEYADAHVNLGIAYGEKGNVDMAIEHFQAAMKLNPNDSVTLHNLANAYRLKGLNDMADEYIRRAETLRKESQQGLE